MLIIVNLPFDQGLLIISQFMLCFSAYFADQFEERERVRRRASFVARSEFFRPCDEDNYSLKVKDGLTFREILWNIVSCSCVSCVSYAEK
jgi:hypothetical protein